jgi:hypothetical protein
MNKGLEMAVINFINSETKINYQEKKVELSKLFLWYKNDFISERTNGKEDALLLE